jgi:hypothetical protein
VIDLGAVPLLPGREVRGKILDEEGQPVPGAAIRTTPVRGIAPHLEKHGGAGVVLRAVSGADGSFAFARRVPAGSYRLLWEQPHDRELRSPLSFDVVLETPVHEMEVRAALLPIVSGRVVLAGWQEGQPVVLPALEIVGTSGKQIYRSKIDPTGAFRIQARPGDKGPLRLDIPAGAVEAYVHKQAIPWGTRDVKIELAAAGRIEVVVVEAGTGLAIEHFAAVCVPMDGPRPMREISWPPAAPHAGGKLVLAEVPLGDCMLHVWAPGPEYAATKQVAFQMKAGPLPSFRVEFERKK